MAGMSTPGDTAHWLVPCHVQAFLLVLQSIAVMDPKLTCTKFRYSEHQPFDSETSFQLMQSLCSHVKWKYVLANMLVQPAYAGWDGANQTLALPVLKQDTFFALKPDFCWIIIPDWVRHTPMNMVPVMQNVWLRPTWEDTRTDTPGLITVTFSARHWAPWRCLY